MWKRKAVWVRSDSTKIDPQRPVPLVCYGDDCACQQVAFDALREAGRDCEIVFTSRSLMSLAAAVKAGFGVMVMPRGRARKTDLEIWEDAPLPKLPELYCGIFLREGGNRTALEELGENLATDLRAEPQPDNRTTLAHMRASKVS
jgi:DNA-binding transcriptional LysR family regulator